MRFSLLLASAASLLTLAACSETRQAASGSPDGGTLVIATPTDADVLLPPLAATQLSREVCDQVFDHLAEIGDNLQTIGDAGFTPRLAQRWDWARDSLSIAFHIDPKARWHDGQPVRASDVRFTVALYKNPKLASPFTPQVANIDSASVRDSLTAVVWFHQRRPEAFYDIAYQVAILPEHLLRDIAPEKLMTSEFARHPVGTGRFRFARWDAGSRLELVADTANYRGRAHLDRVVYTITPDNNTGFTQLLSGQADLFEITTPDQLAQLKGNAKVRAFPYPSLQYAFMGFNLHDPKQPARPHPIFGDARVRRAISMALDRRGMLRNVFDTLGAIAYGPFPRSLGSADTTLRLPPFDTTHAAALLDSLGWKRGADGMRARDGHPLAFTLQVPTSSRVRMTYATLIQDQLRRLGITVDIGGMQFPEFMAHQDARDFDASLNAYSTDPSPGGYTQNWGSGGAHKGGSNSVGYSNPVFDALLDSALTSFDPARARAYAVRAYQVLADDAPAVWLYDVLTVGAISTRIHTAPLRADEWWAHLADWTIPPAERIDRDRIGLGAAKP